MPEHVGPWKLDGVEMISWLLRFDKGGNCISPQTRGQLLDWLAAQGIEHIIFFSHGWNNDFQFAGDLYGGFMRRFEPMLDDVTKKKSAFVGMIWPSTWSPAVDGPKIAAVVPAAGQGESALTSAIVEDVTEPEARDRLRELLESRRLSVDEANEASAIAIGTIADEGEPANVREGGEKADPPLAADVLAAAQALDQDDELDEDFGTVEAANSGVVAAAAGGEFLDPKNLVRVLTVYQMKDRAGRVGANGVHSLLRDILSRTQANVHAVGHSYGGKIILSAICAGDLPRRVRSLLLLQPAINHLCFANNVPGLNVPGGYRSALDRVDQPILTTYSRHDRPLHDLFHLALRRAADFGEQRIAAGGTSAGEPPNRYAALGGYGPRLAHEGLVDPIPFPGEAYSLPAGHRIVGLDGTKDKRINGHGDVVTNVTAWALNSQMGAA